MRSIRLSEYAAVTIVTRLQQLSSLAVEVERSIADFGVLGRLITCNRGVPRALADGLARLHADLAAAIADADRAGVGPPDQGVADRPSAQVIPLRRQRQRQRQ